MLRLLVGEAADAPADEAEQVCVLETNLDDISGELIGYCTTRLWEAGRAGRLHHGHPDEEEPAGREAHGPLPAGRRRRPSRRFCSAKRPPWACAAGWPPGTVLRRQPHAVDDALGAGRGQDRLAPRRPPRFAPEFESCRRIAEEQHVPLREVYEAAQKAFDAKGLAIRD